MEYWIAFQEHAFQDAVFAKAFKARKPSRDHWLNFLIGVSACHISVLQVRKDNALSVQLYIPDNKELYRSLESNKAAIESECNLTFEWREMPDKKASNIEVRKTADFNDPNQRGAQFDWLKNTMLTMKRVFRQYL